MKVILNVFSGRPDPCWDLTAEEASALARYLSDLLPARRTLPEGNLEHRGLTVANPDRLASLPVQIQVFQGIIGVWENGYPTYYHDLHHVEDWLIELARQRGYESLLD
jgi:hypothetical protein